MDISIISDPSHVIQVSPEIISRLIATESPNVFELQRKDWLILNAAYVDGFLTFEPDSDYTGVIGDSIIVFDNETGATYSGTVTDVILSPGLMIVTDIDTPNLQPAYFNDETLYDGFYFEGKLTINEVAQDITIQSYPDTSGKANLDVSGVLQIMISKTKVGDNSQDFTAETTKSGYFTFAYRYCYYGYEGTYTEEGNTWHYCEAVRSEEQGSNLYEFLPTAAGDADFLNQFDRPVYFAGLPFDISFFVPDLGSPPTITATINRYDSENTLLGQDVVSGSISPDSRLYSLNIDFATLETTADHLTISISD